MTTKSKVITVACVLAVALPYIYRQPIVLRVTGMRPFVEERFGGWVEDGAAAHAREHVPNAAAWLKARLTAAGAVARTVGPS